jgi:ATP-binding cassette subfamily B multidrug efflux pump
MIKKIMESIREYKKSSILSPVFVTLEVVMEVVIPLLMARLIDQGLNRGNMRATWFYGIIMLAAAAVSLSFGALAGKFCATASTGLAKNLRHDLFAKVQDFSFKNIDDFSTGSLVTRMTTDVTNVQMAYMLLIRIAFRAPLMLIFSLIMSFSINARLAVDFLIAVPVLAVALGLIIKFAHPLFRKVFKIYDRLNTVVQENLRGIRVVKSYVRKDHEIEKFKGISGDVYETYSAAEKLMALNSPVMQAVIYACMLVIAWVGAKLIVAGSLTTGELTSLITYIMMILMSLMMLSMIFVMLTIAQASGERIVEVLNTESDLSNAPQPIERVKDGSIVFDNVNFSYAGDPDKLSLKDINLAIKSGEQIGIIGETGSAKSSLVQLIPRLYDATTGTVYVGGVDVKDIDLTVLRDRVSMVLQKNVLFAGTIAENLRWGNPNASEAELWRACEVACADEFIKEMPDGLNTMIEQGGTNVSGGQKQRLCIARAVLAKPKILILDDSTSAVDTKTDAKIRQGLKEVIPGTTTLIIAQRISSIEGADRIVIMHHGTIDDVGTSDELLKRNTLYREVYDTQMQMKGGQTHVETEA